MEVGKLYNVPNSTLSDHVIGNSSRAYAGAPGTLSNENEVEISTICQLLAEVGFSSECTTVHYDDSVIIDYLALQGKLNPFGNAEILSRDWWPKISHWSPWTGTKKTTAPFKEACSGK